MNTEEFIKEIAQPAIDCFEQTIAHVEGIINGPIWIDQTHAKRWRYSAELTVKHVCLLRAVRIVSAFNALLVLWQAGYVQEMGILCRTINEFLNDIIFILEGYPTKDLSQNQKRFIEEFSKEEFDDNSATILKSVSRNIVIRKKVLAGVARVINASNPHDLQAMLNTEESAFSGYVHGSYPHIMELCSGPPPRFHVRGVLNTPRIGEWRKQIETHLDRSINVFGLMCSRLELKDAFDELYQRRSILEKQIGVDRSTSS